MPEECKHAWKCIHDYEGDPSIYHGINVIEYYRCIFCQLEVSFIPDDEVPEYEYDPDPED